MNHNKKRNLQRTNINSFECHDQEIHAVDNDAEAVSEGCHRLRSRLVDFTDAKAAIEMSSVTAAV